MAERRCLPIMAVGAAERDALVVHAVHQRGVVLLGDAVVHRVLHPSPGWQQSASPPP